MKLVYVDAGLNSEHGHHATSCRRICGEWRRRGLATSIYGPREATAALCAELKITPLFRLGTYWSVADAVSGWFDTFRVAAEAFAADLACIRELGPDDLLFINSAIPAHLMGLALWARRRDPAPPPHIVVEFGHEPGLEVEWRPPYNVYRTRDPRSDPRAAFYRAAAKALPESLRGRLHCFTFEARCSALFAALLGSDVHTLPYINIPTSPPVARQRGPRPTAAIIGTQRVDKGYHLVPDIAGVLLASSPDIDLLVHNSGPSWMPREQDRLRALARQEARLRLNEEPAGEAAWARMLDQADLVICPYDPVRYHASYSSVAVEALSNGIPVVVPHGTSLHRLVGEQDDCGVAFEEQSVSAIAAAALRLISDYGRHSRGAEIAARRLNENNGPTAMVDAVQALLAGRLPVMRDPKNEVFLRP